MKKILAVLLALVMVLGMATVAFAADPAVGDIITAPTISEYVIDDGADLWVDLATVNVRLNWLQGEGVTSILPGPPVTIGTTAPIVLSAVAVSVWDDINTAAECALIYTVTDNGTDSDIDVLLIAGYAAPDEVYVKVDATFTDGVTSYIYTKVLTVATAVDDKAYINTEVYNAINTAIASHQTIAYVDLSKLAIAGMVTELDFAFITNTWYGQYDLYYMDGGVPVAISDGWYSNYNYLELDFCFFWPDGIRTGQVLGGTSFYFKAADLDYRWAKAIDFNENDGLGGYVKSGTTLFTKAEMIKIIRELTADTTKDPFVFGFAHATTKDYGYSIPKCTISKVVPQQWINVYGHKNLMISIFENSETCPECGAVHNLGHVLDDTVSLDAVTQTQRIDFTTTELYRTLILSKAAVAEAPAAEATDDANPNTGANDVVNVAIVFAVVSLVAAGAYVATKK